VYGANNVLFWATVANSLFIVFLILDAVAWNRGPFKHLRGNTKAGALQPLRRKNGSIVSIFDAAQWAVVAQNRKHAAIPFVLNPSGTRIDECEDKIREDEEITSYPLPMGLLPGYVKLKFGPCNMFHTSVGVEMWNKMMVDSMQAPLIHWMRRHSVQIPNPSIDAVDSYRGRAMLVVRSDGALKSVLFTVPNVRTIFDVCGILSNKNDSNSINNRNLLKNEDVDSQQQLETSKLNSMHHTNLDYSSRSSPSIRIRPRSSSLTSHNSVDYPRRRPRSDTPIYDTSIPTSPPLKYRNKYSVLPKLNLDINSTKTPSNGRQLAEPRLSSSSSVSSSSPPSLNAWVFEIVCKSYVGDDKKMYWYYASYSEFGLEANDLQKVSLKKMIDHLNGGKPSRSLRSVKCKNIFNSGDHKTIAETIKPQRRRSQNSDWLMLRS
jgi:hypothetical protein